MFTADGTVKIIDFGSVKIAGIAELAPLADQEENILGTLNYTAPEYHLGQRGSTRSDLFSLAVITYEMLNGALPYGPMPSQPDKHRLAKLVYVPSFHHNDRVPVWVDGALKKATALNPQLRYGDLSEFLYDLGHPNPAFLNTPQHQPLMERNPLLFWQGLSLLLLLVNFILLYFVSR
jgi:serine/threonine protein kinase